MADIVKNYKIQQKLKDGMLTLHPETYAGIVSTDAFVVTIGDEEKNYAASNVQTILELLAEEIEIASAGGVTGIKIKTDESDPKAQTGVVTVDLTKLTGVSEGANKVEASDSNGKIKIDGVETVVYDESKAPVYSIAKDAESSDYAGVYHMTKTVDGVTTNVGDAINIPKDLVVKSGSIVERDGEKYLQLVLNDEAATKIDVKVTELVDDYTAGTGVKIDSRVVSIDRTATDTWYDAAGKAKELVDELANGRVAALEETVGDSTKGLVKRVTDLENQATKVEASDVNGNIKVDGKEIVVYTLPESVVEDAEYKHITVTEKSVSDGTSTFEKYDDTDISGRVSTLEGKFTNAVSSGVYSVVQVTDGIVTAAGKLVEVGSEGQTEASADLVTGGLFFQEIQ
jgi:uncharacterized Zn ribbon protein